MSRVSDRGIGPQHRLAPGDVLMVAKGVRNQGVVFEGPSEAVASASFFVLRPDPTLVDAHYLAWLLDQPSTQEHLHRNLAGTYVPSITVPAVQSIRVPLPPIAQQRRIVAFHRLARRERELMLALVEQRQLLARLALHTTLYMPPQQP